MDISGRLERPMRRITKRYLDQQWFRGAHIRVERNRRLLYDGAFGYAQYDSEIKEPLGHNRLFDLASLTKLFTAAAVLHIISRGEVSEETAVSQVLSTKQELTGSFYSRTTISDLLRHASGLHPWYPFYTERNGGFEAQLERILRLHRPVRGTVYSDINYMVLARVIEKITGLSLDQAVGELVLEPLGMRHATYHPDPLACAATEFGNRIEQEMTAKLGLSFNGWRDISRALRGQCDDGNCFYYFGGVAGHAGIFADAEDAARLGALFIDGGGILSAKVLKRAGTADSAQRGGGVQFGELYPGQGFGHTGFTGTYLYINPKLSLTVTILTNRLHVSEPVNINGYRLEIVRSVLRKV